MGHIEIETLYGIVPPICVPISLYMLTVSYEITCLDNFRTKYDAQWCHVTVPNTTNRFIHKLLNYFL